MHNITDFFSFSYNLEILDAFIVSLIILVQLISFHYISDIIIKPCTKYCYHKIVRFAPMSQCLLKINPDIHYPSYKRNLSSTGKFVVQFRNSDTCHSRKQEIKSKEPPTDLDSSGRKTTIYPSITKKKAKLPLVFTKSG